jgi:molecular chaperone GrpE (heat shock protein)
LRAQALEQWSYADLQRLAGLVGTSVPTLLGEVDATQALRQECQRLQQQLEQAAEQQRDRWETAALERLEPWLLNWPRAVQAAQANPQIPARNLLALARPIEQLLETWEVEVLGQVGDRLPYDPSWQVAVEGTPEPGAMVTVKRPGYRWRGGLLHRAEVLGSPLDSTL